MKVKGSHTTLVIPTTACFEAVYAAAPMLAWTEFTDAQFTIEPDWGTRPSSLYAELSVPIPICPREGSEHAHTSIEHCFIICLSSNLVLTITPVELMAIVLVKLSREVSATGCARPDTPAKFLG